MKLRQRVWEIVEVARPGDHPSRVFDVGIITLIVLNVVAVVLESVGTLQARWGALFRLVEGVSVAVFSIEYLARIWSCASDPRYGGRWRGRFQFALTPMAVVDLLAILPSLLPFLGIDLRTLRILRMFRLFRLAKLGRYYGSLRLMGRVVHGKREELVLTSLFVGMLLLVSSSVVYYCENEAQPEQFSSIPATFWWAIATLTTVGYGDVYPVTAAGRLFGGLSAFLGIGLFALPAGLLGAGFIEEIQKRKPARTVCPHCGKELG